MEDNLKNLLNRALEVGAAQSKVVEVSGCAHALVPSGYTMQPLYAAIAEHLDRRAEFPRRKEITVNVTEPASFLDYWDQHAEDDSRVYAYASSGKISACFDEHGGPEKQARWRKHWCCLQLKKSEEFETWLKSNRKPVDQTTFAEFLEDNAPDITEPASATFIECARDLKAKSDVTFESKVNMSSGAATFAYKENVTGTWSNGSIEIPERFKIRIQVYVGLEPVVIEARMRYRINSGKLTMWYDLYRISAMEREAFENVILMIEERIGKKVLICD